VCGIAGFSGRFDEDLLERMNRIQAHRGPDDQGTCFLPEAAVGLAHRRLSIIDLSPLGHQPMWDAARAAAITYNGELYNFRELRAELAGAGYAFRGNSDTEVLLNLYRRDGPDMLRLLNGIFAFAIWDPARSTLFLARDGVGVKPLYYAETPRGFLFASELKAILQEESVDRTLDPFAIHAHIGLIWSPAPLTMLRSVRKLEPGHALEVKDGKVTRHWSFYDLPYDQPIQRIPDEDVAPLVRAAIEEAVRRQMVADVPVGAFLSGGADSSAVAALASRYTGGRRLQCFTIGFKDRAFLDEGFGEDLPHAKSVAAALDVDLHTIVVGPEMADSLERMIFHLDEPQADPAALNVLFISHLARENGIKVLLSGAGGDDIFTGYRRHRALALEPWWTWLPPGVRRAMRDATGWFDPMRPFGRRVRKALRYADYDGDRRMASYFLWTDPESQLRLYTPAMAEQLDSIPSYEPLIRTLSRLPAGVDPINRMLYLEGKHFLADHNLNYADKMAMARGVEVRVPLLDPDLIALAARLPVRAKQRGSVGKWALRKAIEPLVPRGVTLRTKTGFGAPVRHWISHELRSFVDDVLSAERLRRRGLFDPAAVRTLIRESASGKVDGSYTILSLLCIELWCRQFVDVKAPVAPAGEFVPSA
jgi:asparagine synthase (glutamine-hydrolysing)